MKRAHSGDDHMHTSMIDVLADKSININEKYSINLAKNQNAGLESKKSCKIIKFSSEWSFNDVLTAINNLKPAEYPNLFIFIIHDPQSTKNEAGHEKLKENVLKFGPARPLIMQLISEDASKIFYKTKSSNQFLFIDDLEANVLNFPSFLNTLLNGKFQNFDEIIKNLKTIQNSSLILRFLRTLDLPEEFFKTLVLKCAACGSKNDLQAALDAPFEEDGKKLSITSQKYLSTIFDDNQSDDDEDSDDEAATTSTQQSSVLLTAVENKNKNVIDCLITLWSHLIQKLPFHHQVRISTTAFETSQFDVLCDLLNTADFPFPEDFKLDNDKSHEKLQKVVKGRTKLITAVTDGNFEKIDDLVRKYYSLKFGYNINNNSAMKEALNSNKPAIFYYLKNYGFQADDCEELLQKLSQKEIDRAQRHAAIQKTVNIENCLRNSQQSVLMLSTMSYIHNKKMTKPTETEYRDNIRKWYGAINKIAPEVLDVAVMNDSLKIIYDFESETVESVSLSGPNTSGITYISNKWIFIGAKITNKNREIQIISTIAQQLCYYVLHVVYENGGKPYYKENFNLAEIFENIVKSIDVWSANTSECPDDECLGMISSVFKDYPAKNFHAELILRVIQILTEFSEDQECSSYIQQKYKNLFNFWHDFVVPELSLFLQRNEEIVRLNSYIEVLSRISKLKIELIASKYTPNFDKNNFIIITTNVPTLLLIDIQRYLKNIHGCLLSTKNIFVDPERFENQKIRGDFYQFCKQYPSMNVVVDCSKGNFKYLEHVFVNKKNNFIFVALNEKQRDELVNICLKICSTNPELLEINYNWLNLTNKSQKNLLKIKVNFQNNENLMLMDVLDLQSDLNNFADIFDDQLLNLLLDNHKIVINAKVGDELDAKKFNYKFKPRKFIKKIQNDDEGDMDAENPKISQEDLPKITKNSQYILISDKAGTGKSWAMRNISKVINDKNPTKWVTYVDLKQFTKKYNEKKVKPEFFTFMIDKILMPKTKFEEKIFQKLYKDGRVCIFFDGFDEIAPDHVEFVEKLMSSFEFNGGNQMWIGTRDYFEVDLKEKFRINQIFKLDEFLKDFGFDLMLKSWIIMDHKRDLNVKNFDEITKNSPKIETYQELSVKIIKKLSIPKNYSIVTPQVYQMIAESFKEETNKDYDINRYKILRACGIILYRIWSDSKGEIRREANIRSQEFELNFWKFHQYAALLILFPNLIEEFFQYYDPSEWINEEILACGFMSFKDGKYYFLYGAFQDFFIAELIIKVLKRKTLENAVLELIVEILTNQTYFGIQIILNDAVEDDSTILDNHGEKLMKFVENFCSMDNFDDYFVYELDCLVDVIVKILTNGSYEQKKGLLSKTVDKVIKSVKSTKMYLKFEKLLLKFLNSDDLKTLVKDKEVLHRIVHSELNIEVFEELIAKLESTYDQEFIRELLRTKRINILCLTSTSENKEDCRIPRCIKTLQKFLTSSEIVELMMDCNQYRETILHICVQTDDKEILKIMWTEVEKIVDPQTLKNMIIEKSQRNHYTILHYAATSTNIEFHKTLWNLLQKCFDNQQELMDLMTQKCLDGCNFLHHLVRTNESDIIEFTFKCLKDNFSCDQYNKILIQKNSLDQNLLQNAVKTSKNIQIFQLLWKVFHDSCESDLKFVEFIKEVDKNGNNVLQLAAYKDVFEFIVNEFEKIATIDDFRQLLSNLNNSNQNLLQISAKYNNSIEFHQVIWLTFQKYFNKSDILEFSRNQDANGHNLLFNAVQSNTKEIAEFIWNQIKKLLNKNDQVEYLKHAGNILEAAIQNVKNQEIHEWIKMLVHEYGILGSEFDMSDYEDAKEEMDCED